MRQARGRWRCSAPDGCQPKEVVGLWTPSISEITQTRFAGCVDLAQHFLFNPVYADLIGLPVPRLIIVSCTVISYLGCRALSVQFLHHLRRRYIALILADKQDSETCGVAAAACADAAGTSYG